MKIGQKLKIGQNWKLDKVESWTKLKIGSNWKSDKIEKNENWIKLKIGQKWKSWPNDERRIK